MSSRKANRADALVESGFRHLQQGQLEQARHCFEQSLTFAPRHADALHLLGIVALQEGNPVAAAELLQRATAIDPRHPAYQANLAYAYVGLERLPDALAAFERAVRLNPSDPELLLGAGNCRAMLGETAQAEAVFRGLVERHPAYALGWLNLANAVKDQERFEEARDLYVRAIELAPQVPEAYGNLGIALHQLDRFEEAERAYRTCLQLKTDYSPAAVNLAITLNSLRRHDEAAALCRAVIARDPVQKNAWPVLGKAHVGLGQWGEALRCYERSIREFPENPEAFGDLGDTLARVGRMKEAFAAFDRAADVGHVSDHIHLIKAMALFSVGRIAEGAAEYAGRYERLALATKPPGLSLATLLPGDLRGLEIHLLGEQGIGDEIFFLRYAPPLKSRGGRIRYYGNPRILSVLARHPVFEQVLANAGSYGKADHSVVIGDLPHLLNPLEKSAYRPPAALNADEAAKLAANTPFPPVQQVHFPLLPPPFELQPLPDRVTAMTARLERLGPPPYVGLSWRAGTNPQEQRGRVWLLFKDIPQEELAAALRGVKGTLISLQRQPRGGETDRLAELVGSPVHDLSTANEDLEDMLALLAAIDEYVGVSNTNMHLRASVGRAARVLMPWPADWRWMVSGETSPWFPGFRIYRQKPGGSWADALGRLRDDLATSCSIR